MVFEKTEMLIADLNNKIGFWSLYDYALLKEQGMVI